VRPAAAADGVGKSLTGRRERALTLLRGLNPLLPPILLAAYPVLSLFQHNQAEIDLKVLWGSLAPAAASGAALFVLFMLLLKRGPKAGVLAALVVVGFFYYGRFYGMGSGWGLTDWELLPAWTALFVLGAFAVLRTKSDLVNLTRVLSAVAAAVLLVPVSKIVIYRIDHPPVRISDPRLWPTGLREPRLAQPLPHHGLVPRVLLRTEDLVQVVFVRPVRVTGLPRQSIKHPGDAGQFQRPRLRDDEIAGEGGGAHAAPPRSQPS